MQYGIIVIGLISSSLTGGIERSKFTNLTSRAEPEEDEAEAGEKEAPSRSRVRKRKIERPKKARAMTKSKAINQFCCQKGINDSLYTILVAVGRDFGDDDEDEAGFLRERDCWAEEATVVVRERELEIRDFPSLKGLAFGDFEMEWRRRWGCV